MNDQDPGALRWVMLALFLWWVAVVLVPAWRTTHQPARQWSQLDKANAWNN